MTLTIYLKSREVFMDRTEYLKKVEKAAYYSTVVHASYGSFINKAPDSLVMYRGAAYVPKAYQIGYDEFGHVVHTAVLQDVKANYSIVNAKLCDVEEYRNGKSNDI